MRVWCILPSPLLVRELLAETDDWALALGAVLCDEDGDLYLIGDVNEVGGVCDDCRLEPAVVAVLPPEEL